VFAPYLPANQVENTRACADRIVMLARGLGERGNQAWVQPGRDYSGPWRETWRIRHL